MFKNLMPGYASAKLQGGAEYPELTGEVRFYGQRDGVLVSVRVRGLPATPTGFFAFHIHDGADCGGEDFADSGMHYDPANLPHPEHAGDLPPLLSCSGEAFMEVLTNRFRIDEIVGKTVIIHDNPDDFTTQPSGNAGKKIACGVIWR